MALKELRDKAAEKLAAMKQMRDKFNERKAAGKTGAELWPDETRSAWEKVNTDYNALIAQIEDEKRSDDVDAKIADAERRAAGGDTEDRTNAGNQRQRPGMDDYTPDLAEGRQVPVDSAGKRFASHAEYAEQRDLAFQSWAGWKSQRNRDERHLAAAKRFGVDPSRSELVINLHATEEHRSLQERMRRMHPLSVEARALSGVSGTAGGFTIGQTMVTQLEVNMLAIGQLLQWCDTITTETGEEMSWPTADDTSNEGEMLGENRETDTDEDPTFAAVKWMAYVFSSKIVKVPVSLLDDSAFNLASELGGMLGTRIGRALNRKATSGTGANQPKGIMVASTLGVTTASATAITSDDIIKLEHSVDPSYRTGNAGYMAHDAVIMQIRLLKDGLGRYLWQDGLRDNRPDTLNGRRIGVNQHMDSALAASNKVLLFGDFSSYKLRRVRQLVIRRLTERYAEFNQEGFVALARADGNLLTAGTPPMKYLKMHA